MPVREWDRDDYSFHAPIRRVEEIDMLDQPGWRVRATIMRSLDDDRDIDLDIVVMRKVWETASPPTVGEDIEGTLWLQGRLWHPGPERKLR